jgi:hypothetical protein
LVIKIVPVDEHMAEGTKIITSQKKWTDDVEKNPKVTGIINWHTHDTDQN